MRYQIISNLFNRQGVLDLDGDEEEVNTSCGDYTRAEADKRINQLEARYPNAYIDWAVAPSDADFDVIS